MRAVDTNVLVRIVTGDDPVQAQLAEAFVSGGAWVSHGVVVETAWVLRTVFKRSPGDIGDALTRLLEEPNFVVQDRSVVQAAIAQYRATPRLGFSDCLVLATARAAGHVPLATFDRELARLDGARLLA